MFTDTVNLNTKKDKISTTDCTIDGEADYSAQFCTQSSVFLFNIKADR